MKKSIRAQGVSFLPEHLIATDDGQWGLWRLFAVRAPGFPIAELLKLASPACAVAADQILAAEESFSAKRTGGEGDVSLQRMALNDSWKHLREVFGEATIHTSQALYEVARQERFQEAVIWQNRHVYHNSIGKLVAPPNGKTDLAYRNSQQRRREEVVETYWQRYCAKNDSIGFFGPLGWGHFVSASEAITVRPGAELLARRRVYFEAWGIETLARIVSSNPALRPWIAPQRHPFIPAGARQGHVPALGMVTFSEEEVTLLAQCDGQRVARDIVAGILASSATLSDAGSVYSLLEELASRGIISWTLRIPVTAHSEEVLRHLLERIEDEPLRLSALESLSELETARNRVALSAGHPLQLDAALADFEAIFSRLTGIEPTRAAGRCSMRTASGTCR